jgi:hypothetical protein
MRVATFSRVGIAILVFSGMIQAQAPYKSPASPVVKPSSYKSPDDAVRALLSAAEKADMAALTKVLGSEANDIIFTGEPAREAELFAAFTEQARAKKTVSMDPKDKNRAYLLIGQNDWPFALPMVKHGSSWSFDSAAGRQELLYRRIGENELDAIQICLGFVEAQHEYALEKHDNSPVNQYAQRIISTPGKQDGLAWQNPDGTWGGPVGENAARAIEKGYSQGDPYHGYYFKVLKGQGKAAPMGEMDFVFKGMMLGGFAVVAFPAEYDVTGVKTFMVSHDGIVYEKDLGLKTSEEAKKIELFNPDDTWQPVASSTQR